jgi:hypothetical protein
MNLTHILTAPTAVVPSDGFDIPFLDFTWLTGTDGSAAGNGLRSVVGMVLAVALIVCAVALLVGVVGWIAGRAGNGSAKAQSLFGGMAGAAVVGALLIGSLSTVAAWGADDQLRAWFGGNHATFAPGGDDGDLTGETVDGPSDSPG